MSAPDELLGDVLALRSALVTLERRFLDLQVNNADLRSAVDSQGATIRNLQAVIQEMAQQEVSR